MKGDAEDLYNLTQIFTGSNPMGNSDKIYTLDMKL
jgi:hypothetical protein